MDIDTSTKQKTWQVYSFGKRNVFRLDLNESREGFCRREKVRTKRTILAVKRGGGWGGWGGGESIYLLCEHIFISY